MQCHGNATLSKEKRACGSLSLNVIDLKTFIGNEENRHIPTWAGSVFHDFSLRKPDKRSRTKGSLVCYQISFQNIHAMTAGMSMLRVDHTGRIANHPNPGSCFRIFEKILA